MSTDQRQSAVARASGLRWFSIVTQVLAHDRSVSGSLLAGALATRLFLWLLPWALVMSGLLGFAASDDERSSVRTAREYGFSGVAAELVGQTAYQAERGRLITVLIGVALLVFAGYQLRQALDKVHSVVWRTPRALRWRRVAVSAVRLSMVLSVVFLLAIGISAISTASPVLALLALLIDIACYTVLGLVLLAPSAPVTGVRDLLAGAIVIAIGMQGLHLVTRYYLVDRLERASELYGAMGTACTILLWLMIAARLIVVGDVLNAVLRNRAPPASSETPATAVPK